MTQPITVTPAALFTLFAARMAEVGHAPHRQERTVLRLRQSEIRGGGLDRQAFYLAAATLPYPGEGSGRALAPRHRPPRPRTRGRHVAREQRAARGTGEA